MTVDIPQFLSDERENAAPDLVPMYLEFEDFWDRRLWHQLTEALLKFFKDPQSAPQRLSVYNNFVLTFADKINQLNLVSIALEASTQIKSTDPSSRINDGFLCYTTVIT